MADFILTLLKLTPFHNLLPCDDTVGKQTNDIDKEKEFYLEIKLSAEDVLAHEPDLTPLLRSTVLHSSTVSFSHLIAKSICNRIIQSCGPTTSFCPNKLYYIILSGMNSDELEMGHTMIDAVKEDIMACVRRDPACETPLEVILFMKGFAALVCHRAARRCWLKESKPGDTTSSRKTRFVSLWLQSQASAAFGVDIHPGAEIGKAVMIDHATGVVIGETAKVGDGCTILHGVTLGGTGKDKGDRHPKIGKHVLIGAGSKILGNIVIGDSAKIGAGSVVLKPIPHGATAVGAPAKIIGWATEAKPGSDVDLSLRNIQCLESFDDSSGETLDTVQEESEENEESDDDALVENTIDRRQQFQQTRFTAKSGNVSSRNASSRHVSSRPSVCAFRTFSTRNRFNLEHVLTYEKLEEILTKEGVTESEIGEVFLELCKKHHSTVVSESDFRNDFPAIAEKFTTLDPKRCEEMASQTVL